MKKRTKIFLIGGSLALSGLGLTTLAVAAIEKHHKHGSYHHMKPFAADTNKDGLISMDELLAQNGKRFETLDSNGDGTITPAEFSARSMAMFTRFDANNDSMLARDEMPKRRHKKKHHRHHDDDHSHSYDTSALDTDAADIGMHNKMHSLIVLPAPETYQTDG